MSCVDSLIRAIVRAYCVEHDLELGDVTVGITVTADGYTACLFAADELVTAEEGELIEEALLALAKEVLRRSSPRDAARGNLSDVVAEVER